MKITYNQHAMRQHQARSTAIFRAADELKAAREKFRQAEMAYRIALDKKPEDYTPSHGDVQHLCTDC
jgi:hypothetical protein